MATKQVPLAEVQKHNKAEDLWVVIEDKVYDLTQFQNEHPGGEDVLQDVAGKDGSKEFKEVGHSKEARSMMAQYLVGELAVADRKKNVSPKSSRCKNCVVS